MSGKTYQWYLDTTSDDSLATCAGSSDYKEIDSLRKQIAKEIEKDGLKNEECSAHDFSEYMTRIITEFYMRSAEKVSEVITVREYDEPAFSDFKKAFDAGIRDLMLLVNEYDYNENNSEEESYEDNVAHVNKFIENAHYLVVFVSYGDEYFVVYRKEGQNGAMRESGKTTHLEWEVQGNYGSGWECVCTENSCDEAHATLKEYNDNETDVPHRVKCVVVKDNPEKQA